MRVRERTRIRNDLELETHGMIYHSTRLPGIGRSILAYVKEIIKLFGFVLDSLFCKIIKPKKP